MVALRKNLFVDSLVEHFKNHENVKCINFQFDNLKFSQEKCFGFSFSTTTDTCMKEVIDSCLCGVFWKKIMETLKALMILTIIVLNLVSKGLSFYYTAIFTGPLISYRALRYNQFAVTFIDGSSCPDVSLKTSQN